MTPKNKTSGLYVQAILSERGKAMARKGREKARPVAAHKFAIGQTVYYSPGIFETADGKGVYRVVRLLPAEGAGNQYRLESTSGGHDRVVCESQLSLR